MDAGFVILTLLHRNDAFSSRAVLTTHLDANQKTSMKLKPYIQLIMVFFSIESGGDIMRWCPLDTRSNMNTLIASDSTTDLFCIVRWRHPVAGGIPVSGLCIPVCRSQNVWNSSGRLSETENQISVLDVMCGSIQDTNSEEYQLVF